jgi:hypothetical protein
LVSVGCLFGAVVPAQARETNLITPNTVAQPGPFKLLRYDDDNTSFKDPANRHGFLDEIKWLALNEDGSVVLSLGGEFREQYEYYVHENWGLFAAPDKHLLSRIMEDADLHLGERTRVFLELKSGFITWNSYPPTPVDVDHLDFNQLFLDEKWKQQEGGAFTLRIGRQELDYGAERLVAVREGPNVRQGFDGAKGIFEIGRSRLDLYWTLPVTTYPGIFDDHPSAGEQLWSAYLTSAPEGLPFHFDLYYLGFRHDGAVFAAGVQDELRHSLGGRIFRAPETDRSGFDFDVEGLDQFGSFGTQSISAWTLANDSGYTIEPLPLEPRIALRASIASGDHNQGQGPLGTFNPLFPRGDYLDFSQELGPANFISMNPYLNLHLSPSLSVTVGYNALWRESIEDGIYNPSMAIVRLPGGATGRFIGGETAITSSYQVTQNIKFIGGYAHLTAGDFIVETGPADASDYATIYAYFTY